MDGKEGLSPEELAAMEEDENQDEEILKSVAGEEEEEAPAESGKKEEAPAAAAPVEGGEGAPAAAPAAAPAEGILAGVDMAEAPVVPMFTPQYTEELRPDLQQKLDEARAKFEEGEGGMDLAAYEKVQRQVNAENLSWQTGNARWEAEQKAFFGKFADYAAPGPLRDALDGEVNRLDATAQGKTLSGLELLMAAKTRVEAALGIARPAPAKSEAPAAPAQRPASPRPAPATHALGAMPAAAAAEVGRGEFAHLETLQGLDLERAVAALSPDQRERWTMEG